MFKQKPAFSSVELYKSCTELPLHNWIQISLDNDLKWLVKNGIASQETLTQTWEDIYNEYCQITKDTTNDYLLRLKIGIEKLDKKLIIIQTVVDYIAHAWVTNQRRSEKLINFLQTDMGFQLKYESLERDLQRTITLAKSDLHKLRQKEKEYQEFTAKSNSVKWSYFDYIEQLSTLSSEQGYKMNVYETTVAEYVAAINLFKAKHGREQRSN